MRKEVNGNWVDRVNHTTQTPDENLTDIITGFFSGDSLSKEEIYKICSDCIEVAEDTYGYTRIAETVIEELYDFESAIELFQKAEAVIADTCDCILLASSITENLSDLNWAMELIQKALKKAEIEQSAVLYMLIAELYCDMFTDNFRGRATYELAEKYAKSEDEFELLAKSILEYLNDKNWYSRLINRAVIKSPRFLCIDELCLN